MPLVSAWGYRGCYLHRHTGPRASRHRHCRYCARWRRAEAEYARDRWEKEEA